jgi:AAA15 family ATPase/GTPase
MDENKNFYISEVKIAGFRSLRATEVKLLPGLNIMIGQNGSGKSNILAFLFECGDIFFGNTLNLEYDMASTNFEFQFMINQVNYKLANSQTDHKFSLSFYQEGQKTVGLEVDFDVILQKKRRFSDNDILFYKGIKQIDFPFFGFTTFQLPQSGFKRYSEGAKVVINLEPAKKIEIEGRVYVDPNNPLAYSSFIEFLDTEIQTAINAQIEEQLNDNHMLNSLAELGILEDDEQLQKIRRYLSHYSQIQDIGFTKANNELDEKKQQIRTTYYLTFLVDGTWQKWETLSDGTQRMFYLITEVLLAEGLVLIEEPELGIHPHQFFKIMQFLKEQSAYKQIIISTHAPEALDVLGPDELDRILITQMTPEGTKTSHLGEKQKRKAQRYMQENDNLSNYWKHSDLETV